MVNDRDHTRLLHMLDYSNEALTLVEGRSRDEVDFDILWQVLTEELPDLVSALKKIV